MVLITYNEKSLRKHGITHDQIQEAITDPLRVEFDMPENFNLDPNYSLSNMENFRQMLIGYTYANVLLEIGIEMLGDEAIHIFHAQKVSPTYRKKYEKWLKNAQTN